MAEQRDYQWVQMRSWHAVETPTDRVRTFQTVCGRKAVIGRDEQLQETIPGTEKTCERCLRIVTRRNELAAADQAVIDAATEATAPITHPLDVVGQGEAQVVGD